MKQTQTETELIKAKKRAEAIGEYMNEFYTQRQIKELTNSELENLDKYETKEQEWANMQS